MAPPRPAPLATSPNVALQAHRCWREDERAGADGAPPVLDEIVGTNEARDARGVFVTASCLLRSWMNERHRRRWRAPAACSCVCCGRGVGPGRAICGDAGLFFVARCVAGDRTISRPRLGVAPRCRRSRTLIARCRGGRCRGLHRWVRRSRVGP